MFETSGPRGDRAGNIILEVLRAELPDLDVTLQSRPTFLRTAHVRLGKKLGQAVHAGDAAFGVASSVIKRRRRLSLVLVVASADGRVIFDKTIRLPRRRPDKRVKAVMRDLARAVQDELRAASPPEPEPVPVAGPEPMTVADTGTTIPTISEPVTSAEPTSAPPAPVVTPSTEEPPAAVSRPRRRSRDGFHAAVHGGAGGLLIKNDIATTVQGGELTIDVGMTMLTTAGVELQYDDWLVFSGWFRYYGATIGHGYEGDDPSTAREEPLVEPREIGCTGIGTTLLLGSGMPIGPLIGGLRAGVAYDSFSADRQTLTTSAVADGVAVLVPSWTRLSLLGGIALGYGNLATSGLSGELGGAVVPFAVHEESPRTSGESSSVLGGQGWFRVRYAFTDLFGSAGGLFADVRADIEYLRIQYEGNGTRQALGGTETVQASRETRLTLGAWISVGYVY